MSSGDRANLANSYDKPTDNEPKSVDETSADQSCTPTSNSGADLEQNDRALRPSKIPVLKAKHTENSGNDVSSSRSPSREEYDAGRTLSAYSSIPTSPVTGKKYRSPLSTPVKPLDRSRKLTNGTASNNSPCDSVNAPTTNEVTTNVARVNAVSPVQTSRSIVDASNVASLATVVAKNESSSNRDLSNYSTDDKSQGDTNFNTESVKEHASPTSNETPSSEKKPKFKWMFGPHKNANVVGTLVCEEM